MSASQETGTKISQCIEFPKDPTQLGVIKEQLLNEIRAKFPNCSAENILRTYSTAKVEGQSRVITSLVVELKEGIEVALPSGEMLLVNHLRWHYKDGVCVGDDEIFKGMFSPYTGGYTQIPWVNLAGNNYIPVPHTEYTAPSAEFNLLQHFLGMLNLEDPTLAGYCNNYWQMLKAV